MSKQRKSRKSSRAPVILIVVLLALVGVLVGLGVVGGVVYFSWKHTVQEKSAPPIGDSGSKEFKPDAEMAQRLEANDYVLKRSQLKLKLPRGFKEDFSRSQDEFEEFEFRDASLRNPKDGTQPAIYVQVAFVPEDAWGNVKSDLAEYLNKAVIPALERRGARVSRRGSPQEGTIQGVKFIRLEVDGAWTGRTDRYALYFGTSKPYLITLRGECPPDRVDEYLPLLEASIRTVRR